MRKLPGLQRGELEAEVLRVLWARGALTTPEVFDAVGAERNLAYTTVLTILQRLHRKGLVEREDGGRAHRYAPSITRDEFDRIRALDLAAALSRLSEAGVAAFLAEAQRLDPAVVEALRRRLAEDL